MQNLNTQSNTLHYLNNYINTNCNNYTHCNLYKWKQYVYNPKQNCDYIIMRITVFTLQIILQIHACFCVLKTTN